MCAYITASRVQCEIFRKTLIRKLNCKHNEKFYQYDRLREQKKININRFNFTTGFCTVQLTFSEINVITIRIFFKSNFFLIFY